MFDFELLKRLCDIPGPSGYEDDVRELIRNEIQDHVDQLYCDPMGNLVAIKGTCPEILFDAHTDEVGFMITGIMEDGSLRFHQIGSVTPGILPGKRVRIGKKKIPGVIGAVPKHLIKNKTPEITYDTLHIYVGVNSKEDAERIVSVGDFAVFDTDCSFLGVGEKAVCSRNMDDRLGCYLLIRLIKNDRVKNAAFAFSVQEESGCRGAAAIAEEVPFRYGIAVDTTSAANLPGVRDEDQVCALRKGGVLSFIDRMTTYDNKWITSIFKDLEDHGISIQTKGRNVGGTNASVYQKIGIGHKSLSLSTPAYFIHGPLSVVATEDIESMECSLVEIYLFLSNDMEGGNT